MDPLSESQLVSISWTMIFLGVCSFVTLVFVRAAPYGRYDGEWFWGPKINGRAAWIIQELPSFAVPLYFWISQYSSNQHLRIISTNTILLSIFLTHYLNRTFIYPMQIKNGKPTPFLIMMMAFVFCLFNGVIQGSQLTNPDVFRSYQLSLNSFQFWLGVCIFYAGMYINLQADNILRSLRSSPNDKGYHIPYGGMFRYVSGANFLGEIIEWFGFAIASNNLVAFAFAIFTFCNIAPRGVQHHKWYKTHFSSSYPKERKAIIPFLW
jgi:3-oxo-5-alpha-steroid 4-dehydrogenase 1